MIVTVAAIMPTTRQDCARCAAGTSGRAAGTDRRQDPDMADPQDQETPGPAYKRLGDRVLEVGEDAVYVGIAVALILTAAVLLVIAGQEVVALARDRTQDAAIEVLDALLLLFIVVELLYAVRMTVARRQLVAEPFLLVGIIASIKEIVVLSVKAAEAVGTGQKFTDQILEVAVLGGLVLLLGVTAWLLRLKEREPEEAAPA
jgi:uncharacterized membrane protein (DUF373 family)